MSSARFIIGDSLTVLRSLPAASVDLVMTSSPYFAKRTYLPKDHPDKALEVGTELTPGEFLETLLTLTDEIARVLVPWGSIWWNLGDSAAYSGGSGGDYLPGGDREGQAAYEGTAARSGRWGRVKDGFPLAKSVCWIPQLFGASLAYGRNILTGEEHHQWVTRPPVTWCKENPAVGELIDACRVGTELLVFAALAGSYFFDLDAVRSARDYDQRKIKSSRYVGHPAYRENQTRPDQSCNPLGAPPLDWWVVSTAQFTGAHYAVMPGDLLDVPMRASVPERVCRVCSLPWERIVRCAQCGAAGGNSYVRSFRRSCTCPKDQPRPWRRTAEWQEPCAHDDWRNGLVLDPFAGTGTTLMVATGHGRDAIGIDIDERNADLALKRVGMFLTVEANP